MSYRPALVSSPASVAALRHRHGRRLCLIPTCASGPPRAAVDRGAALRDRWQPRLVAAQSPPPLAARAVRRDAETGLAVLLSVLAAVMAFSLSLIFLSFSAHRAMQKMEILANKLTNIVAEEVPGTLASLKLSFLEISDLTNQLKNIRKRLASRFGKGGGSVASFQTGLK